MEAVGSAGYPVFVDEDRSTDVSASKDQTGLPRPPFILCNLSTIDLPLEFGFATYCGDNPSREAPAFRMHVLGAPNVSISRTQGTQWPLLSVLRWAGVPKVRSGSGKVHVTKSRLGGRGGSELRASQQGSRNRQGKEEGPAKL